jgi:transposase-like protein
VPKLAALMDEAEADVLAFMVFPKDHRPKIHSINPLERLNGEIKRRTCANRMTNGRFSAADACPWKRSRRLAMIRSSSCQPRRPDSPAMPAG